MGRGGYPLRRSAAQRRAGASPAARPGSSGAAGRRRRQRPLQFFDDERTVRHDGDDEELQPRSESKPKPKHQALQRHQHPDVDHRELGERFHPHPQHLEHLHVLDDGDGRRRPPQRNARDRRRSASPNQRGRAEAPRHGCDPSGRHRQHRQRPVEQSGPPHQDPQLPVLETAVRKLVSLLVFSVLAQAFGVCSSAAQDVRIKDIAKPQGVTDNQLVGYGIVTGLQGTGDSTSVLFTSKTIQNVLQSFGLTVNTNDVRTRNVAAVIVTAKLPPFAHSGDNVDVVVSSMGDATTLQGGTLVLTELRGPNNLVYATAQGPISVGGFSVGTQSAAAGQNGISQNFTAVGRIPNGAVIARDMITNLTPDQSGGFNYVLTEPDYNTAARLAQVINQKFPGSAHALDAETIHVTLPPKYANDTVGFLAETGDLTVNAGQTAKVVVNERTGTVVMGGDIKLAPVAVAHGNLTIQIATTNQVVPPGPFTNAQSRTQTNTTIQATQSGQKLIYISGAATLAQVVRALNTIGVSPRDLISIVQALRQAGSLQAEVQII